MLSVHYIVQTGLYLHSKTTFRPATLPEFIVSFLSVNSQTFSSPWLFSSNVSQRAPDSAPAERPHRNILRCRCVSFPLLPCQQTRQIRFHEVISCYCFLHRRGQESMSLAEMFYFTEYEVQRGKQRLKRYSVSS